MFQDFRNFVQLKSTFTDLFVVGIDDCGANSADGLTCNTVIDSNMEPPGNNQAIPEEFLRS
eukprot:CAMPEP_0196733278 /NCGR_PEP_ID=MMETSP1091-20130531/12409_1 /TAXON_ID=302021 /ORGANISM="Rhodomonas sp., Strain CCMP768" /LENGTH=60 /DNA_ID=CAMNT_0042076641 /DNA_START=24 /DNA_END=206 /DNA_ORIENTATION=-